MSESKLINACNLNRYEEKAVGLNLQLNLKLSSPLKSKLNVNPKIAYESQPNACKIINITNKMIINV